MAARCSGKECAIFDEHTPTGHREDSISIPSRCAPSGPAYARKNNAAPSAAATLREVVCCSVRCRSFMRTGQRADIDGMQNAKQLCLHPETQNSLMTICNCFHYGLTLLQCLAAQHDVLPLQESLQAISACSTALGVYTKTLPADTPPFFRLFDKLSQYFFEGAGATGSTSGQLRTSIVRLLDCGPDDIAGLV